MKIRIAVVIKQDRDINKNRRFLDSLTVPQYALAGTSDPTTYLTVTILSKCIKP